MRAVSHVERCNLLHVMQFIYVSIYISALLPNWIPLFSRSHLLHRTSQRQSPSSPVDRDGPSNRSIPAGWAATVSSRDLLLDHAEQTEKARRRLPRWPRTLLREGREDMNCSALTSLVLPFVLSGTRLMILGLISRMDFSLKSDVFFPANIMASLAPEWAI